MKMISAAMKYDVGDWEKTVTFNKSPALLWIKVQIKMLLVIGR